MRMFTQEQLTQELESISGELDAAAYEEDVMGLLGEVERIRDELQVLQAQLEYLAVRDKLAMKLEVASSRIDHYQAIVEELQEHPPCIVEQEDVRWEFGYQTIYAHGSWEALNRECNFVKLDDFTQLGYWEGGKQ